MKNRKEIIRIRISHRFYAFLKRPSLENTSIRRQKNRFLDTTFSIYSKRMKRYNNFQTFDSSRKKKGCLVGAQKERDLTPLLSSAMNKNLNIFRLLLTVPIFFNLNYLKRGNGSWPKLLPMIDRSKGKGKVERWDQDLRGGIDF